MPVRPITPVKNLVARADARSTGGPPPPGGWGKGKVLLDRGKRESHDNHPEDGPPQSMDHLMEMLNINLQERIKKQKRGKNTPPRIDIRKREEKMRGLFGGKE